MDAGSPSVAASRSTTRVESRSSPAGDLRSESGSNSGSASGEDASSDSEENAQLEPKAELRPRKTLLHSLPNELITMVFEHVGDDSRALALFIPDLQFRYFAHRCIYKNLRLVVWEPTSPSAVTAASLGNGVYAEIVLIKTQAVICTFTRMHVPTASTPFRRH